MAGATEKVLFTGKTHNQAGADGSARSADGFIDLKMPQPHPAAENLFSAAWSACYMGAIQVAAAQQKVKLSGEPSIDTEIDLVHTGGVNYFLRARMSVSIPGVDRSTAEALAHAAHGICPYSKATHGNIDVTTTVK